MKRLLLLLILWPSLAFAAFSYDGTDDGHTVNDINQPDTDTFSVCFWVKSDSLTLQDTILYYGNGTTSGAGRGWAFSIGDNGLGGKGIRPALYINSTTRSVPVKGALTANTWTHVCFTKNGTWDNKTYIDGTSYDLGGVDAGAAQNSTDDMAFAVAVPNNFAGLGYGDIEIAQVAYWTTELSAAQVTSIADKSTCPTAVNAASLVFFSYVADPIAASNPSISGTYASITTNGAPVSSTDPASLPCSPDPSTFSISGTITGDEVEGVTVTCEPTCGSDVSAVDGTYSITGIDADTAYTLTPTLTGYSFTPTDITGTLTANVTDADFVSATTSTDSGNVSRSDIISADCSATTGNKTGALVVDDCTVGGSGRFEMYESGVTKRCRLTYQTAAGL